MIRWPYIVMDGDLFRCRYINGARVLVNLTAPRRHYIRAQLRRLTA